MPFDFSSWPPTITDEQLQALTLHATTYALGNGLAYLPDVTPQPPAPTSAIHAPLALFPSAFSRKMFERALRIQKAYNVLYSRIAMDIDFLDRVMGSEVGVGRGDYFIRELWNEWKQIRDKDGVVQPYHLGIFRSDYLLHQPNPNERPSLKQVEFNTISSAFGSLAEKVADLHKFLVLETGYFNSSPYLKSENLPENRPISGLAQGLAEAHKAYGVPDAFILFVVIDGERNIFDHKWLEYELLNKYSIHVVRLSFEQVRKFTTVDPKTKVLHATLPSGTLFSGVSRVEISTVYLRTGYTSDNYSGKIDFETRGYLEQTRAIKCPTIPLQLAGGKKVQEELTRPGVLEHFLANEARWPGPTFSADDLAEMRETWMGMWSLDLNDNPTNTPTDSGEPWGVRRARQEALNLVLKPQRDGGGNNVYKSNIPPFLDSLTSEEREAWIAMELILTPPGAGNYLVRAGGAHIGVLKTDVISELGVFGWSLFGGGKHDGEETAGWLLRTKSKDSDEGGVAAGFSVLDSVVLVDD